MCWRACVDHKQEFPEQLADSVAPEPDAPVEERNLLTESFRIWIDPEVDRRVAAGTLKVPFYLYAAQIIFDPGPPSRNIVRINNEVKAQFVAETDLPPDVELGVTFDNDRIKGIREVLLTDEDMDCGHITIIRYGQYWHVAMNARYKATEVTLLTDTASQFLACAEFALDKGMLNAVAENLFAAVELAAKCPFILMADDRIVGARKHSAVQSAYNQWGKYGNVPEDAVKALNRLSNLRHKARYLQGQSDLTVDEAKGMISTIAEMIEDARQQIPKYAPSRTSKTESLPGPSTQGGDRPEGPLRVTG
jgi:uncharacterized protein (UPF0332 family)